MIEHSVVNSGNAGGYTVCGFDWIADFKKKNGNNFFSIFGNPIAIWRRIAVVGTKRVARICYAEWHDN
ncbi:MAG: hypothetical protein AB8G17_17995 [Gammaproteobacteria bacterium]